jgi:ABC-type spermidine/putrescine transport system permease subunit I
MTITNPEPSPELFLKVMKRIRREERILAFKKITFLSVLLVASGIALVPSVKMLVQEIESSGFIQFASLAFSDFGIVEAYWQSFALTILQTIPALSLALCLAVLLTFLQSIKGLSKNIKTVSNIKHLAIN